MNQINTLLSARINSLFTSDMQKKNREKQNTTPFFDTNKIEQTDTPTVSKIQYNSLCTIIYAMKQQLDEMLHVFNNTDNALSQYQNTDDTTLTSTKRVIEGVFNGEHMVSADGHIYYIPANYASKSKLVEGDVMKVTITKDGKLIFKQISPIIRKTLLGELVCNEQGQWIVAVQEKLYRVLTASITFHHGKSGNQVTIIVPKDTQSNWGAVEHIFSV